MAIDLDGADKYFETHSKSAVWHNYPPEIRSAAVIHARMIFSRALNRKMKDDYSEYSVENPDRYRDDFACYEQALYLLMEGPVLQSDTAIPYPIAMPEDPEVRRSEDSGIGRAYYSPTALRWLGWNGAYTIRG